VKRGVKLGKNRRATTCDGPASPCLNWPTLQVWKKSPSLGLGWLSFKLTPTLPGKRPPWLVRCTPCLESSWLAYKLSLVIFLRWTVFFSSHLFSYLLPYFIKEVLTLPDEMASFAAVEASSFLYFLLGIGVVVMSPDIFILGNHLPYDARLRVQQRVQQRVQLARMACVYSEPRSVVTAARPITTIRLSH